VQVRVLWATTAVVAAVLCFLPLTSLLGYESSAVMGVVLGLVAMRLTSLELDEDGGPLPLNGVNPRPLAWWLDRLAARLVLTLPAAGLLALNALRVKNCDPLSGAVFWAVIPMVSVLAGHALVFCGAAVAGSGKAGWRLGVLVVGADLAWFAARLVIEPPITGMNLLFGYFAGSIYDEALSVPEPLLWFRALVVAVSLASVFAVEVTARRHTRRAVGPAAWGLVAFGLVGAVLAWQAEDHGYWLEREDIAERLGAQVESEHFVIHYDPGALEAREVQSMVDDHEYRYAELQTFFNEDPAQTAGRKLGVFVYPDRTTQHRLFGSRNTFVARPWTYEMHIRWNSPGDTAVAHELAHLFTAPFGGGPLSLATDGGLFVHLGLVEGIALAADWPPGELTPHEAAAAMRSLDIAPSLASLFEPSGFWSQPSGKAYTLMGSFVRWLVDTEGIEKFKELYAYGDWEGVYGRQPQDLVTDWEAFIDQLDIDESRLEMARFKYSRRTIFKKTCARTIAELKRKADNARRRGDFERALSLQSEVLSFQKGEPEPGLDIAKLLIRLERYDEATTILDEMLARTGKRHLKPKMRAQVEELRGDILWQAGDRGSAAGAYQECLGWGLSDGERRQLALKIRGATTPDTAFSERTYSYLFETKGRTRLVWATRAWVEVAPDDPLARYLLGFQLSQGGLATEAIPYLQGAPGVLAHTALDEQRRLMLARALGRADRMDEAHAVWVQLLGAQSSRVRLLAVEGIDRLRFGRGETLESHPQAP